MVKNPIQPDDGDPRHGTRGGYINHGCRCADCTRANSDAHRLYQQRRRRELGLRTRAQWKADVRARRQPCGTHAAYVRHRKKNQPACAKCKAAEARYRADQRALATA